MASQAKTSSHPKTPTKSRKRRRPYRIGHWLPQNQEVLKEWLDDIIMKANAEALPLDPIIQEFKSVVNKNATLHMQYSEMFTEVTHSQTPTDKPQVRDYDQMFRCVNHIMTKWAPQFNKYGLVGFPINSILNWAMGTTYGYAAFLDVEANRHWKKVLDKWGEFLKSERSRYVLVSDKPWGWFSDDAMAAMPNFAEEFICDPTDEHYGFKSWDDFFIRQFREGIRPIAEGDHIIANACESHPFDLQHNVQMTDVFWLKEQKYSLLHMLADDPLTHKFDGGTIYQAFLSALSYHHWHSPVDGKVVKAYKIPGTYYSASLAEGEDEASPNKSQGYICQVAARALIFIEATNSAIGLMCFMAVGMAEVSTCEIRPDLIPIDGRPKPTVKKGEEIGMFHFGGSTHCLIFRPEVNIEFIDKVHKLLDDGSDNIPVNSKIATVTP